MSVGLVVRAHTFCPPVGLIVRSIWLAGLLYDLDLAKSKAIICQY
jgi:hypothetical protein